MGYLAVVTGADLNFLHTDIEELEEEKTEQQRRELRRRIKRQTERNN